MNNYKESKKENINKLKAKIKTIPEKSGVYIFKKNDEILYIGKATNLKQRLNSHLNNPQTTASLNIRKFANNIEFIVTVDANYALYLEERLIKKHNPKYNIKLKYNTYPYLVIDYNQEFPGIYITKENFQDNKRYFGPYQPKEARILLETIYKVFLIRDCPGIKPGRKITPCMSYHLDRCSAPCVDYITKEAYNKNLNKAIDFLEGNYLEISSYLENQIKLNSKNLKFEKALDLDNFNKSISKSLDETINIKFKDLDIITIAYDKNKYNKIHSAYKQLNENETSDINKINDNFNLDKKLTQELSQELSQELFEDLNKSLTDNSLLNINKEIDNKNKLEKEKINNEKINNEKTNNEKTNNEELENNKLNDEKRSDNKVSQEVIDISDTQNIRFLINFWQFRNYRFLNYKTIEINSYENLINTLRGYLPRYYLTNKLPNKILINLEDIELLNKEFQISNLDSEFFNLDNKEFTDLKEKYFSYQQTTEFKFIKPNNKEKALSLERHQELEKLLNLQINRIEIYDVSHLQGVHNVGGMVVYQNYNLLKSHYRKFKLTEQNDDYDSLKEMLTRRINNFNKKDLSFQSRPELIVIDGGIGQLNIIKELFKENNINDIYLISLAKDQEIIYTQDGEIIKLANNDKARLMLQYLRDNVHNYAISFNRQRRLKDITKNEK